MSYGALYFNTDPVLPQKDGDYQRAQFQEYGDPDDPGLNAPSPLSSRHLAKVSHLSSLLFPAFSQIVVG